MINAIPSDEEGLGLLRRLLYGVLMAAVRNEIDICDERGEVVLIDVCQLLDLPQLKFVCLAFGFGRRLSLLGACVL